MIPKLTLDTNLSMEYWQNGPKRNVLDRLLKYADAELVDLAVTNRIRADVPRSPLAEQIDALPALGVSETGSVFRLDHSHLDGGDMLGSDRFTRTSDAICLEMQRRGLKPPDWRDWDHLHGHYLKRRDVFLTWDGAILECARELKEELRLTVMRPEDYLVILETQVKQ